MEYQCRNCGGPLSEQDGMWVVQYGEGSGEVLLIECPKCRELNAFPPGEPERKARVGITPTLGQRRLFELADKLALDTPSHLNQTIRQMVSLSAGLLGGAIAFVDKKLVASWSYSLAIFLLLAALIVGVVGMIPAAYEGRRGHVSAFGRHLESSIRRKGRIAFWSPLLVAVALFVLVVGFLTKPCH